MRKQVPTPVSKEADLLRRELPGRSVASKPSCKCGHSESKHLHGKDCIAMIEVIRHGVTQKVFCPCYLFREAK